MCSCMAPPQLCSPPLEPLEPVSLSIEGGQQLCLQRLWQATAARGQAPVVQRPTVAEVPRQRRKQRCGSHAAAAGAGPGQQSAGFCAPPATAGAARGAVRGCCRCCSCHNPRASAGQQWTHLASAQPTEPNPALAQAGPQCPATGPPPWQQSGAQRPAQLARPAQEQPERIRSSEVLAWLTQVSATVTKMA